MQKRKEKKQLSRTIKGTEHSSKSLTQTNSLTHAKFPFSFETSFSADFPCMTPPLPLSTAFSNTVPPVAAAAFLWRRKSRTMSAMSRPETEDPSTKTVERPKPSVRARSKGTTWVKHIATEERSEKPVMTEAKERRRKSWFT